MPEHDARQDHGGASRDVDGVAAVLGQWERTRATIVGSGLSHRHLTIVLWRPGSPTQLLVACVGPEYYCGPMDWDDAQVRVARVPGDQRVPYKAEFELRDERAGVRLVGCDVHLIEEPAPHWRRTLNGDESGEANGAG